MTDSATKLEAAIDVGGTFMDVVVARLGSTPGVEVAKVSRRELAATGTLQGCLRTLAERLGGDLTDIKTLVVGTTVVTNALLEHDFAPTALLTTAGFRDVLEIGRARRPSSFDLKVRRPNPIVPAERRLEIQERTSADGEVICQIDPEQVRRVLASLDTSGLEAIAISFLFSYVNPEAEQLARQIAEDVLDIPVSASSDVLPAIREYERTNTTVINAATVPKMARFIESLDELIFSESQQLYVMGSEGGALTVTEAQRLPVRCTMSGPVGGVLASTRLDADNTARLLTLDIGGTSADVAFIDRGQLEFAESRAVGDHAVAMPSIEVETVGAGGGSIANITELGLLSVGPQSAGADPGPACYRRGGTRPTVTDAHVALGMLGADSMLGGDFHVDVDAAIQAISTRIADPLAISWQEAAAGLLDVVNASIVRPLRRMSVARGIDPRTISLVAFGGAGPLHALDVARMLSIPTVLVPPRPGVWSAVGLLGADVRYSVTRTWLRDSRDLAEDDIAAELNSAYTDLAKKAAADGLEPEILDKAAHVRLQYPGQGHSLSVPLLTTTSELLNQFHVLHLERYGHYQPDANVRIVEYTASLTLARTATHIPIPEHEGNATAPAETRPLWLDSSTQVEVPVFSRPLLPVGARLIGPAIVEQYDSTIVMRAADELVVEPDGSLQLTPHVQNPAPHNEEI